MYTKAFGSSRSQRQSSLNQSRSALQQKNAVLSRAQNNTSTISYGDAQVIADATGLDVHQVRSGWSNETRRREIIAQYQQGVDESRRAYETELDNIYRNANG